ncbi:MAG: response regulator, partial [Pseudomonadales bacterium]|nr:response regulator [Pseudomonadales bacterium]
MVVQHALVVDDSKSARVMLSRQLQKLGLTVDSVESAKDAFSYLESSRPDLIFMDHMMPGIDGLVAAKLIWNNINTRTIPVVMYTSKDGDEYVQSAKAHGAVAVLPKPAKAHQIETIIERINTILLEEGEMRSTSDDVTAYAGLSQLDVEAIVEASVASAIERFGEENQSTIKELLRGEAERLKGTLNEKMMSAESQIDVLNNQMEEAIENISTQDALCQEVSEKVDAERAESVSYERVNELIAIGVSFHPISQLHSKIVTADADVF